MIIVRADEVTQLPSRMATPDTRYAGEGSAIAQGGKQVESVAMQAVQLQRTLDRRQAEAQGVVEAATYYGKTFDDVEAYLANQSERIKREGILPKTAREEAAKYFDSVINQYSREVAEKNPLGVDNYARSIQSYRAQRLHDFNVESTKAFVDRQKKDLQYNLDRYEAEALLADSMGDSETYRGAIKNRDVLIARVSEGDSALLTPTEATTLKQEMVERLEAKRLMNEVIRAPFVALDKISRGEYRSMEPKQLHDLQTAAEVSAQRSIARGDHAEHAAAKAREEDAITLRNNILFRGFGDAATNQGSDPEGAMTEASLNRHKLGREYDNLMTALRSIAKGEAKYNSPEALRSIRTEIERAPTQKTFDRLVRLHKDGLITNETFSADTTRLFDRIEHFTKGPAAERLAQTNRAIDTLKQGLKLTGPMDFDRLSNETSVMFEFLVRSRAESQDKTLLERTPWDIAVEQYEKSQASLIDQATASAATLVEPFGFKSEADARDAFLEKRPGVTKQISDMAIWLFRRKAAQAAEQRTVTPAAPHEKKKSIR